MKKENSKGFALIEAILFIVIAGMLGAVVWFVFSSTKSTDKSLDNAANLHNSVQKSKTAMTPAAAPTPVPVDETADWTPYSSVLGKFSLKYPKTWVQPTNKAACAAGFFDRALYLGPDSASVLKCAAEYFGQLAVVSVTGDKRADSVLSTDYGTITKTEVTVQNVSGQRFRGVAKKPSADAVFAPEEGTVEVYYVFYSGGNTYTASYIQAPKSKDILKDFDLMITKTLKFSS